MALARSTCPGAPISMYDDPHYNGGGMAPCWIPWEENGEKTREKNGENN